MSETLSIACDPDKDVNIAMEKLSIAEKEKASSTLGQNRRTSRYSTELFRLLVGKERSSFFAHQGILERSPFFKACCNDGFKEREERLIILPDESPDDFDYVLEFLYSGFLREHTYTSDRVSRTDVFDAETLYAESWALSWHPSARRSAEAAENWWPTAEFIDRSPSQSSSVEEAPAEDSDGPRSSTSEPQPDTADNSSHPEQPTEPGHPDEAKEHLAVLMRVYKLADKFLMDHLRECIVHQILTGANYCEPRDFFDIVSQLYNYKIKPPPSLDEAFRLYIGYYLKATGPDDKLLPELIAKGGPVAGEIFSVMRDLLRVDARYRIPSTGWDSTAAGWT